MEAMKVQFDHNFWPKSIVCIVCTVVGILSYNIRPDSCGQFTVRRVASVRGNCKHAHCVYLRVSHGQKRHEKPLYEVHQDEKVKDEEAALTGVNRR